MKAVRLLMALGLAGILVGCGSTPNPSSRPSATTAGTIPDRPEQLQFSPLNYEPPDPADFRVQLRSGPVAYVASDRELPLVDILVLVHTGNYLDPKGQEGLGVITGYLLSQGGTRSWTADDLEERLAFLAANLSSGVNDTQGSVRMNLLSKDLDEGLAILREVLTEPRFQQDKLDLRKEQLLQSMRQRNDDSANIEARERYFLAYGDDFWSNQYETEHSIQSITRDDVKAFHRRWFHPDNFVVAACGDFDRADMIARLEGLFADWPFEGNTPPPIPTNTVFAPSGVFIVDKDVNQGRVSVLLPGVMRTAPDFFSIILMNQILGGGGFTSRIVNRVRSDEGLAYSAGSVFPGGIYFPEPFIAGFQTKSRTVAYATSIVLDQMQRMAQEPVTQAELDTVQRFMIDAFPRMFASKTATMRRFANDEFTGRFQVDPGYYKTYRDNIAAVSIEDIQQVAKAHLEERAPTILVVGNEKDILKGDPNHPERLEDLTHGPVVQVPLRDPMTMQPLGKNTDSQ